MNREIKQKRLLRNFKINLWLLEKQIKFSKKIDFQPKKQVFEVWVFIRKTKFIVVN